MSETVLQRLYSSIESIDEVWIERATRKQLSLTKPPGSLGRLEETANRLAAIQQTLTPAVRRKRIYVVAGDHGVSTEGVSAYPREVTPQMVLNFLNGGAAINVLCKHGAIDVKVVDAGVDADLSREVGLLTVKTIRGTKNMAVGPALERSEVERLIRAGIDLSNQSFADRISLLGVGEMGIGNTTAASAITAALTREDPATLTDRGTGVDDPSLARKIEVIRTAIAVNSPDPNDPMDVLTKVGGAEIAVMVGLIIGAAANRIAVISDGFISTAAAAIAVKLCDQVRGYLFVAHRSVERGHAVLIDLIGVQPLLDLSMRLGEGTGAALAMHVVDASAKLLCEMATFGEAGVSDKQ